MKIIKKISLLAVLLTIVLVPKISKAEGVLDWLIDFSDEDAIERTFKKDFDVMDGVYLRVENTNGKIEIIPNTESNKVDVFAIITSRRGEKEFDKIKIDIDIDEQNMFVQTKYLERNVKINISYTIKVPKSMKVKSVETTNGGIKLYKVSGNMKVLTTNGNIKIDEIDGIVRAETTNGNIKIKKTTGIKDINTTNGSISAEILEINDDLEINTTNGSVSIWLSSNLDVKLEASTFNGRVSLNDDIDMNIRKLNKRKLRGTIGNGSNMIDIDTTNGSINIYEL